MLGYGLTVTLEIRHSVIPGGFVRACARREHPPSSANHFPATIISGCHDRPVRAFLLRIPSSFNSSTPCLSWMSPCPLSSVLVLVFPRAHASLCRKRFIILVIPSIDASIVVYCAEREPAYFKLVYSLVFLYSRPAFLFPRSCGKKTGEPSLVNFRSQFHTFRLPRDPRSS